MGERIFIIDGHPDADEVRELRLARLDFRILRANADVHSASPPPAIAVQQESLRWATRWVERLRRPGQDGG